MKLKWYLVLRNVVLKMAGIRTDSPTMTVLREEAATDIDGNTYKVVKIGNQWWMAENLKVTHYRNGDPIPNVTSNSGWEGLSTGAYCVYDNKESHADTYGYLYNWYAVNDWGNIAPAGWHVPTDEEWKQLEMHLGMSRSKADDELSRGKKEGGKMKEAGTTHWDSPNTFATTASGLSARPGGWRGGDGYRRMGDSAYFWTSTEGSFKHAWDRCLSCRSSDVYRSDSRSGWGCSVRCVRD